MTKYIYSADSLIGGSSGALDYIDGDILKNGDVALVIDSTTSISSVYVLNIDSTSAENSPFIIIPDTNDNDKRWVLTSTQSSSFLTGPASYSFIDDPNTKISYNNPGIEIISNGNSAINISDEGRVGIGKAAPIAPYNLDVNGMAQFYIGNFSYGLVSEFVAAQGLSSGDATFDETVRIRYDQLMIQDDGTNIAPSICFESDRDTGLYSSGPNELMFATGATDALHINSSGNVGIGAEAASEGAKLLVNGSIYTNGTMSCYYADVDYMTIDYIGANDIYASGYISGGSFFAEDGLEATPSLSFVDDQNTGIYRPGDNQIGISTDGTSIMNISVDGLQIGNGERITTITDSYTGVGSTTELATTDAITTNMSDSMNMLMHSAYLNTSNNLMTGYGKSYFPRHTFDNYSLDTWDEDDKLGALYFNTLDNSSGLFRLMSSITVEHLEPGTGHTYPYTGLRFYTQSSADPDLTQALAMTIDNYQVVKFENTPLINGREVLTEDSTTISIISIWQHGTGDKIYYNDGFVGINNSDPAYNLDVDGNINVTGTVNGYYSNIEYGEIYYLECQAITVNSDIFTSEIQVGDGSEESPSINFDSESTSGLYYIAGTNDLGISINEVQKFGINNTGIYTSGNLDVAGNLDVNGSAITNSLITGNIDSTGNISTTDITASGDIDITGEYKINGVPAVRGRVDSFGSVDASSTVEIDLFSAGQGVGARYDYSVISVEGNGPSSIRTGSILVAWDKEEEDILWNETVTEDIGVTGDTSDIELSLDWWSGNIQLNVINSGDILFKVYFIRQIIGMDVSYGI